MSDEAIYVAAVGVLAERGSNGLTLARVAGALGVTPAAVRQRFGSKRGLLLGLARRRASGVQAGLAAAKERQGARLDALEAFLMGRIEGLDDPVRLANAISAYVDNAGDAELRALFEGELAEMGRCVGELLADAAAAGELSAPVTPALTSTVFAAFEGALTIWAIAPRGTVDERVHEALAVVLRRQVSR
jgi:AcrR family transcriptional regulator